MSKNEKLKNSSSGEGSSTYRDIITRGHQGGGKVTKPPKRPPIPNLDTSAIPPLQGSGKGSSVNTSNQDADGGND